MIAKTQNETNKNGLASFDEAPASWNTRYIDPNGFECQITLRGESGSELLERAASAIACLLKNGCLPYCYRLPSTRKETPPEEPVNPPDSNGTNGGNGGNGKTGNPAWCPLHHCEMRRWEKDGRVWYSHKVDGGWCRGK